MPDTTTVATVDNRAKTNFFSDILSGAGKQLGNILGQKTGEQADPFTSKTELVSAGFFDILYERARSGKDSAVKKAVDKFRGTKTGQNFISETKKQEIEAMIRNPWTWAIAGVLLVAIIIMRSR